MDPRSEPQVVTAYRVVIVDDHPLFRAALRSAVCAACATGEFFEADSVATRFDTLEHQPNADLLLLDLNLPGAHGFSALAYLRGAYPELPVIVVSALDDATTVHQAMAFGAQGFLSKSANADSICASVRAVLRGELVTPPAIGAAAPHYPTTRRSRSRSDSRSSPRSSSVSSASSARVDSTNRSRTSCRSRKPP